MKNTYCHVVLGGTFDHFHSGHKRILDFAFHYGTHVTIGIVGKTVLKEKQLPTILETYSIRKDSVMSYVSLNAWNKKCTIIELKDIYGPAVTDAKFEAIIVTRETKPNAIKINEGRVENGMSPLKILEIPFMKGSDNKIIRSTRVRYGLINRDGERYLSLFTSRKQLSLPPRLRELLRKPLGQIIQGEHRFRTLTAQKAARVIQRAEPTIFITVGDIVTQSLKQAKCHINLMIIDHKSRRKILQNKIPSADVSPIINPAGVIRQDVVRKLHSMLAQAIEEKKCHLLLIKGEEDLLALPAILLAPLGSIVAYGQADLGIILIHVTEDKKEQVAGIIKQFE